MGKRGPKGKITRELMDAIRRIKAKHPNYGRTRTARELRQGGFMVSDSAASIALRRLGLQLPPKKRTTGAS